MAWTVEELIEELKNYGDHVPVIIEIETEDDVRDIPEFTLDDGIVEDQPTVKLVIEDY